MSGESNSSKIRNGFCIYVNAIVGGLIPLVRDELDRPCFFTTREEAEREVVGEFMTRLQEYLDGERDFEDATSLDEFIIEVVLYPDGSIHDEHGRVF